MSRYEGNLKENNIFPLSTLKRRFLWPTARGAEAFLSADEDDIHIQMCLWWCGILFFNHMSWCKGHKWERNGFINWLCPVLECTVCCGTSNSGWWVPPFAISGAASRPHIVHSHTWERVCIVMTLLAVEKLLRYCQQSHTIN